MNATKKILITQRPDPRHQDIPVKNPAYWHITRKADQNTTNINTNLGSKPLANSNNNGSNLSNSQHMQNSGHNRLRMEMSPDVHMRQFTAMAAVASMSQPGTPQSSRENKGFLSSNKTLSNQLYLLQDTSQARNIDTSILPSFAAPVSLTSSPSSAPAPAVPSHHFSLNPNQNLNANNNNLNSNSPHQQQQQQLKSLVSTCQQRISELADKITVIEARLDHISSESVNSHQLQLKISSAVQNILSTVRLDIGTNQQNLLKLISSVRGEITATVDSRIGSLKQNNNFMDLLEQANKENRRRQESIKQDFTQIKDQITRLKCSLEDQVARLTIQNSRRSIARTSEQVSASHGSNTSRQLNFRYSVSQQSNSADVPTVEDVVLEEWTYFLDEDGFLIDNMSHYLLDQDGEKIKLEPGHLVKLRANGLLHI